MVQGLLGINTDLEFDVRGIKGRGRCVFLKSPEVVKSGKFLMECMGDLISFKTASKREKVYSKNGEGCLMFYFCFLGRRYILDATRKYSSFSRLLKHSTDPNCKLHPPIATDYESEQPRLAIYTTRSIHPGEELTIDYGLRRRNLSWLHSNSFIFSETQDFDHEGLSSSCISYVHYEADNQPIVNVAEIFQASLSLNEDDNLKSADTPDNEVRVDAEGSDNNKDNDIREGADMLEEEASSDQEVTFKCTHNCQVELLKTQVFMTDLDMERFQSIFTPYFVIEDEAAFEQSLSEELTQNWKFFHYLIKKGNSFNTLRDILYELFYHKNNFHVFWSN